RTTAVLPIPSLRPVEDHRALRSFPTRRSSDLLQSTALGFVAVLPVAATREGTALAPGGVRIRLASAAAPDATLLQALCADLGLRSEEHTSGLQSRENLVCRRLLEK